MNMKNEFKMAAPWVTYFEKLKALFEQDPEIINMRLVEENGGYRIKIYVAKEDKAYAISKLLPFVACFGNVTVPIVIYSGKEEDNWIDFFVDAFRGNPIIKEIIESVGPTEDMNYVVFKKEVVQYYNDNMQSMDGFSSTLYENIAREIFKDSPTGTFFCTAK